MKFVIVSNYFNHHQKPFCEMMYKYTEGSFAFISTATMSEERIKLGYGLDAIPEYVKCSYTDMISYDACIKLINSAEVVLYGSAPYAMLKERLRLGKIVLKYSERLFKKKCKWYKFLFLKTKMYFDWKVYPNVYLLASSAYAASDYAKLGLFKGKTYKWGYFPPTIQYASIDKLISEKEENSILWCARFIDWKHPEIPVMIAKRLKKDGYKFSLKMIGTGAMTDEIKILAKQKEVSDNVQLTGAMNPEQVRSHMEKSQIFLFTSDRNEGWGAVLNEAMNSGCAVVANHVIGSVPFLIENEKNGMIYRDGDTESLYIAIKRLLDDPNFRDGLGKSAYHTIDSLWNAETSAQRINILANKLNTQNTSKLFDVGPCSEATIIEDDWF